MSRGRWGGWDEVGGLDGWRVRGLREEGKGGSRGLLGAGR